MRSFGFIISIGLLVVVICAFAAKEKLKKIHYLGQAAPPDMEFIPGNDSIPSFFISKSQETNLAYATYLDWLTMVYKDYPKVSVLATPHQIDSGELTKFNDPILRPQLRNPAFAYYPVTGIDWRQIQEYLCWKTDRLNESILMRLDYLKSNPNVTNEDNFNIDAFIGGQYEGMVKRLIPGKSYTNPASLSDNVFGRVFPFIFPGYRLPTEEEWEYAAKGDFRNKTISRGGAYPYGKKYFIFDYFYNDRVMNTRNLLWNYAENAGNYEPADRNRIKGGTSYDNRYYGVYNIGDNVKEWMIDEYSPVMRHYSTPTAVYSENGFILAADSLIKNADGYLLKKDSLGRMIYRTMGISGNGNDFRVMQYRYRLVKTYTTRAPNPDSLKIKLAQKENIQKSASTYGRYGSYGYTAPWGFEPTKVGDKWINLEYYKIGTVNAVPWLILDTNKVLNTPAYRDERMFITTRHWEYINGHEPFVHDRVVKTGSWKHPSTIARESMKETDGSADVGFRTIIPYLGMPVSRRNLVKWK